MMKEKKQKVTKKSVMWIQLNAKNRQIGCNCNLKHGEVWYLHQANMGIQYLIRRNHASSKHHAPEKKKQQIKQE